MRKDFDSWNVLKKKINDSIKDPYFKEREIWWCNLGLNVSYEQNGKGSSFTRPMLVLKKFNRKIFFGVPLSTKIKSDRYYYLINFKGNTQSVIISQARVFSTDRMISRMGSLTLDQFNKIKGKISEEILS